MWLNFIYIMELAGFLDLLNENGMIERAKITEDSDGGFSNRLKVQKYVYLAKYFDLGFPYEYEMHLRGPYSRQLTREYYRLDSNLARSSSKPHALDFPKKDEYLALVKDKSESWLELATTILEKKDEYGRDRLLDYIEMIKDGYPRSVMEQVLSEIPGDLMQKKI